MATWTTIADTTLEPGKPARSIDAIALRDNPIAIAEGAAGAPRIAAGALQTGNPERDWVLARTSDASVGVVGTYAMLRHTTTAQNPGNTSSGSNLEYTSVNNNSGPTPGGTWRCMGNTTAQEAVVWLRIS